jgi:hypothetical protein
MSDETRAIISEKAKIRYKDKTKNPMYGKKHSDEARKKMVAHSHHLSGKDNPNYGNKYDEDRSLKMSETIKKWRADHPDEAAKIDARNTNMLKTLKPASKRVRCVETGEVWRSMTECASEIGVKICSLCDQIKGRSKTCAGRHFEYVYD